MTPRIVCVDDEPQSRRCAAAARTRIEHCASYEGVREPILVRVQA
jgi:hypothetical protein